jgi:hypothetical protein
MMSEIKTNIYEMNLLKTSFRDLVTTLKFRKETMTHENSNAWDLMKLANAYIVFDEAGNLLDKSICLNNMANIYFLN